MKMIAVKLEDRQVKMLEKISRATHVPKSALIRRGIDRIMREIQEDVVTPELRQEIDRLLQEDRELLRRLAKA